jgi:hypothetical protein
MKPAWFDVWGNVGLGWVWFYVNPKKSSGSASDF